MRARSIIAIVVGATVLLILGGVLAVAMGGGERSVGAIGDRSYSSGRTGLFAETQSGMQYLGPLASFTGCEPRGTVEELSATEAQQAGFKKQVTGVEVEPCEITFGAALMQQPLYDWLSDTLGGTASPKTIWIVEANLNGQPQDAVQLSGVELAKIVFPEADASDVHPTAEIGATLRATAADHPYPCCGAFSGNVSAGSTSSSRIARNAYFRFELGSLPSNHVGSVSSLVVTQDPSGDVHFGDVEVTVSLSDTSQWAQWFKQSVLQANNNNPFSGRKQGRLAFTTSVGTPELLVIEFQDVGVYRRGPATPGSGSTSTYQQTARDVYSLFVEGATFTGPPPAAGSQTTSSQSTSTQTTTAQTTTAQTTTAQTTTAQTTTATTTTIQTPPQPPPTEGTIAAPEGLEGQAGENQALLRWQPVSGATGYVILMSLSPKEEFTQVGESGEAKEPSYTAEKLESGRTYYFVVRAVNGDQQSENSKTAQIDIK